MGTDLKTKPINLYSLAKEYLISADGDVEEAIADLVAALSNSRNLLLAVVEEAVREAVRSNVTLHMRSERSAIINNRTIRKSTFDPAAATKDLETFHKRLYLDFPLKGGIRLRDATRSLVLEQAQDYGKRELDAGVKSRWLTAIAERLRNDKQTVGKVLSEELVERLFEEAK